MSETQGARKFDLLMLASALAALTLQGCGDYACSVEQLGYGCSDCKSEKECSCSLGHERRIRLLANGEETESCAFTCSEEQIMSGCTECKDRNYCTACAEGHGADNGNCAYQCNSQQLGAGCLKCASAGDCTSCKEGMILEAGTCVWGCNAEQVGMRCNACNNSVTPQCTSCEDGYEVRGDFCISECILKGETDISPGMSHMTPEVRSGYEYQRMCIDEEVGHFFIIGDWGGAYANGRYIYGDGAAGDNTQHKAYNYGDNGLDRHAQKLVANQMNALARVRHPRFVINVGDSFYFGGLEEPGCGGDPKKAWNDKRWNAVLESKYDLPHPTDPSVQIPWFGVLGNHDYGGLHFDSGWDHQIYYTYKPGVRWRMPGLWWNQKVNWRTFSMEIFMLDGNYAEARPVGVDPYHNLCQNKQAPSNGYCSGPGYTELHHGNCVWWHLANWNKQIDWLRVKLAESRADYTAVVAHYPSNCQDARLKALLDTNGVDLCIVGHVHWQQMGQVHYGTHCQPDSPCDAPLQIISGGGGGISAEIKATPDNEMYGFVDLELTRDELTAKIVNSHGKDNFAIWRLPRRKKLALGEVSTMENTSPDSVVV